MSKILIGKIAPRLRGVWTRSQNYERLDIVNYAGSGYIALKDNSGALPTNESVWMLIARRGEDGDGSVVSQELRNELDGMKELIYDNRTDCNTLLNEISKLQERCTDISNAFQQEIDVYEEKIESMRELVNEVRDDCNINSQSIGSLEETCRDLNDRIDQEINAEDLKIKAVDDKVYNNTQSIKTINAKLEQIETKMAQYDIMYKWYLKQIEESKLN